MSHLINDPNLLDFTDSVHSISIESSNSENLTDNDIGFSDNDSNSTVTDSNSTVPIENSFLNASVNKKFTDFYDQMCTSSRATSTPSLRLFRKITTLHL